MVAELCPKCREPLTRVASRVMCLALTPCVYDVPRPRYVGGRKVAIVPTKTVDWMVFQALRSKPWQGRADIAEQTGLEPNRVGSALWSMTRSSIIRMIKAPGAKSVYGCADEPTDPPKIGAGADLDDRIQHELQRRPWRPVADLSKVLRARPDLVRRRLVKMHRDGLADRQGGYGTTMLYGPAAGEGADA